MARRKFTIFDQLLIGGLLVILVGFFAYFSFTQMATSSLVRLRGEAIQLVKSKTSLTSIQTFNIVTTDETYYSLTGKNQMGEDLGVILPKSGGLITVLPLSQGVPADKFSQNGEASVDLALYKGKPVWEANTVKDFKIYDFKSGEEIR